MSDSTESCNVHIAKTIMIVPASIPTLAPFAPLLELAVLALHALLALTPGGTPPLQLSRWDEWHAGWMALRKTHAGEHGNCNVMIITGFE